MSFWANLVFLCERIGVFYSFIVWTDIFFLVVSVNSVFVYYMLLNLSWLLQGISDIA